MVAAQERRLNGSTRHRPRLHGFVCMYLPMRLCVNPQHAWPGRLRGLALTCAASWALAAPSYPTISEGFIAPVTTRLTACSTIQGSSIRPNTKANSSKVSVPVTSTKALTGLPLAATTTRVTLGVAT